MSKDNPAIAELEATERFDKDHMADRLTGRNGLRTNPPKAQDDTDLEKYVGRMAIWYANPMGSIPVMAHFDLQNWIDENMDTDVKVTGILESEGKEFLRHIDDLIIEILAEEFGIDASYARKHRD